MATVGQTLLLPEVGWKRYDDRDSNINYVGNWTSMTITGYYNNTVTDSRTLDSYYEFQFRGTKLRIIDAKANNRSTNVVVSIDGVEESYSSYSSSTVRGVLVYEKIGLSNGVHTVRVTNKDTGILGIDAIDIDDDGYFGVINKILILSDKSKAYSMDIDLGGKKLLSGAGVTLSNNGKTGAISGVVATIVGEKAVSSGKYYWEVSTNTSSYSYGTGVTKDGLDYEKSQRNSDSRIYYNSGNKSDGTSVAYGEEYKANDIISVLLNMDDGTLEFWKNGVSQGVAFTNVKELGSVRPSAVRSSTNGETTFTFRFEESELVYSPPSGYIPFGEDMRKVVSIYSLSEQNFINHGLNKGTEVDLNAEMTNKVFIEDTSTPLGDGKVFKKSIDATKTSIKKVDIK